MIPEDHRAQHRAELRMFWRGIARSVAIVIAWILVGTCAIEALKLTW